MTRRPIFYLGTHVPSWLATASVPLFVSHRRLTRLANLPTAAVQWGLDSGGFSELSLFGGWRTTPAEYITATVLYDTVIGRMEWAAPQDWMCEPDMLAKTGLYVAEHQQRTVDNYVELCARWADASDQDCPFMPVLQGWQPGDYVTCIGRYADAGVDVHNVALVGVGSVCRRQATSDIRAVLEAVLDGDPDMPLHGFGVKTSGLQLYGDLLTTCDSMAWSYGARREPPAVGCQRAHCGNCLHAAMDWRNRLAVK